MEGKGLNVVHTRATPGVDGLAWISDRGHREASGEQPLEQPALSNGSVLVLIEQDDVETRSDFFTGFWIAIEDLLREAHLIGVIPQVSCRLVVAPLPDEERECDSTMGCVRNLPTLATFSAEFEQFLDEGEIVLDEFSGLDGEFAELLVEREHLFSDRSRALSDSGEPLDE